MTELWQTFLHAVSFFTRIPVKIDYSQERLNRASAFFPLVGWLVGAWSALIFLLAIQVFPVTVAVGLSIAASVLFTGAFHEDGFADVSDGFGGGWTAEQTLEIMKDSRLGTYGALGLFLVVALKWATLAQLPIETIPPTLLAAHALSRFASVIIIKFGTYARADLTSKAKPLATRMTWTGFIAAAVFGVAPLFLDPTFLWSPIPVLIITWWMFRWFKRRLGGYTGDCLGAVQQVTEIAIYLTILGVL